MLHVIQTKLMLALIHYSILILYDIYLEIQKTVPSNATENSDFMGARKLKHCFLFSSHRGRASDVFTARCTSA